MIDEAIYIGALFEVNAGQFFCSLFAPVLNAGEMLEPGKLYGYAGGATADDAVRAARETLWKGI